jgi:two-component system sensor histidine kinase DegS
VALYALVEADGALGQGLAAAYLVLAVGLSWVSAAERERRELVALAADTVLALLAVRSDNPPLALCCVCLVAAHVAIVTIHRRRLRRVAYVLSERADQAVQRERERLAADFHDGPMQVFTGLQLRLDVVRKLMDDSPAEAAVELDEFRQSALRQSAEMREFMNRLRGGGTGEIGEIDLLEACADLARLFERDTGMAVHLIGQQDDGDGLPHRIAHELLQVIREALHNAFKHSGASKVRLEVSVEDQGVHIEVEDAGVGFPFRGAYRLAELEERGVGPASIMRRVRDLGGELVLESRPEIGSKLVIQVPR